MKQPKRFNPDGIFFDQWIHPADVPGYNPHINPLLDASILHYFVRVGVADSGHLKTAQTYLDWQAAARSRTNAKSTRYEQGDGGAGLDEISSNYITLITKLPLYQQRKAEEAIALRQIQKKEYEVLYNIRFGYISAIDQISNLMNEIASPIESACVIHNFVRSFFPVAPQVRPEIRQPA